MPFLPFDPRGNLDRHRGNLPHWRQRGATYFITTRLGDSLPQGKLKQWHEERHAWLQAHGMESTADLEKVPAQWRWQVRERFHARVQRWLDVGFGECLLGGAVVAKLVADSLRHFDGERYTLDARVVMPNHLHALICPFEKHSLGKIVQGVKSFTAREVNRMMGRAGPSWQAELYDRIVRSEEELVHWRRYIVQNPVKARLREGRFLVGTGSGIHGG